MELGGATPSILNEQYTPEWSLGLEPARGRGPNVSLEARMSNLDRSECLATRSKVSLRKSVWEE